MFIERYGQEIFSNLKMSRFYQKYLNGLQNSKSSGEDPGGAAIDPTSMTLSTSTTKGAVVNKSEFVRTMFVFQLNYAMTIIHQKLTLSDF